MAQRWKRGWSVSGAERIPSHLDQSGQREESPKVRLERQEVPGELGLVGPLRYIALILSAMKIGLNLGNDTNEHMFEQISAKLIGRERG